MSSDAKSILGTMKNSVNKPQFLEREKSRSGIELTVRGNVTKTVFVRSLLFNVLRC